MKGFKLCFMLAASRAAVGNGILVVHVLCDEWVEVI
jgi:hypothetical protein